MRYSKFANSYLLLLCCSFTVVFLLACGFNVLIDPYSFFGTSHIPGINAKKPRPDSSIGRVKLAAAKRMRPAILLLGNSRIDVGIDPKSLSWNGRAVYNLGVPGASICSDLANLRALSEVQAPGIVILGIDFLDFPTKDVHVEKCPRAEADGNLRDWALAAATLTAIEASIKTLLVQRDVFADILTDEGLSPMRNYNRTAESDGYYAMFRQRAIETAKRLQRLPKRITVPGAETSMEFETLKAIVRAATDEGSKIDVIIYPYHVQYLAMFGQAGWWPLFEEWKRRVVGEVAAARRNARSGVARVWDFSGLTLYQREPIPEPSDRTTVMAWYWEAGHFKTTLGDQIVSRVNAPTTAVGSCDDFGASLSVENVERCLAVQRDLIDRYLVQNPRMASDVERMLRLVRDGISDDSENLQ